MEILWVCYGNWAEDALQIDYTTHRLYATMVSWTSDANPVEIRWTLYGITTAVCTGTASNLIAKSLGNQIWNIVEIPWTWPGNGV